MTSDSPDIIVAVDLGTTYTGVAWARPQKSLVLQSPIQVIHNWPGSSAKNEQKVHTCLIYNQDGSLSSWGSLCEDDDAAGKRRREFFKIFLDQPTLDAAHQAGIAQAPTSVPEAKELVSDYLLQIYQHVKSTVELHTGIGHVGWQSLSVEFIFSVPTTWRNQGILNIFKDAIQSAGFGTEGVDHSATVELTESEAAAVGTIKSSTVNFQSGDIFLSIDAGGGTTDFAVMQVVEARDPFPSLSQINQVDGIGIGSTLIDQAFVSLVNSRLGQFPELVQSLPPDCADRLVRSERFRTMKHKFGERVYESATYKLPLDGVSYHFDHPAARIEQGKLVLTWEEVQALFDPHIESILRKIQEQLSWMQKNDVNRPVGHMILSGGLGSSKYVRDRLQHELMVLSHPYAHQVKIIQAPDPQLVVVKGLLLDRLQKLDSGDAPVIVSRIARASYGMGCKAQYDSNIHFGQIVKKDAYDGKLYAMGQLEWLIRKMETLTPSAVVKRKARRFIFKGKKYYFCTFDVKSIIGPADLRFELWFAGQRFSRNHDPLKVTWDSEGEKVGG
ncbi:Hsp70 family chaperone [Seiridium cupressi]